MDAIELLQDQHEEISNLFFKVDASQGEVRREQFRKLAKLLTLHAHLEEEMFYLALRFAHTQDFLRNSVEEHSRVKVMVAQLVKMKPDSLQFVLALLELRAAVEAHVTEEKALLFPLAERVLGVEGLALLGEALETRQEELAAPGGLQTFSQSAEYAQA